MDTLVINYQAVLVASVASYLIGWAWHSPLLFMKQWMHLSGMTKEKMESMNKRSMMRSMVIMFALVLLTAYVLVHLVVLLGVHTLSSALQLGFWVWLGFYATTQMGGFLWEGKPFALYVLQAGQTLVCTLAMAAILGVWQ